MGTNSPSKGGRIQWKLRMVLKNISSFKGGGKGGGEREE